LVTARAFWVSGQASQQALLDAGCEVVWSSKAGPLPLDDLISALDGCDAVIGSSDPYNAAVFAACPNLKVVARCGVGTDSVDMRAATAAGIIATNTPGAMAEGVADYTFGLMLAVCRSIPAANEMMRSGGWGELRGASVFQKTLGLVGVGRIGQSVAQRASGFCMKVLSYDPILAASGTVPAGIEFVDLDTLLAESDFISLHAPATADSVGMFNAKTFAKMKPTAYIINTARGALINDEDLIAALDAGTIAGAALDVYAQEPLPADHPLRSAKRCVLSPHNAFNALESTQEMSRQSAVSVLELMRGVRAANICNPEVLVSPALRMAVPAAV
jgi:phosphoglycerate dehydrogenase-like enzyme